MTAKANGRTWARVMAVGPSVGRRLGRAVALAVVAGVVPAAALAHPLGNFTINHASGLRIEADRIVVDHVIDMAEIPTFSAVHEIDTDVDGTVSDTERAAAATERCADQARALELTIGGDRVALGVTGSALSLPMGQGAPTLRLVCRLQATVSVGVAGKVTFVDPTFAERAGWREITVVGDRMTVSGSVGAVSPSARLTRYPSGLLAQAPAVGSVAFSVVAGGPALPPLVQPELAGTDGATATESTAAVPGGIGELGGDLAGLFGAKELTPLVIVLSLLAAAGLGVLHALSPGHGKTVMAAYLVGSRGTSRQAVGLGAVVTASHTLGVLALGAISLWASAIVPPERLYPILGMVSGVVVVVIAGWLLLGIGRRWWSDRAAERAHVAAHAAGTTHVHDHDHGHGHAHEEPGTDDAAGWHTHGGVRHTHVPPAGQTIRWRGLVALGLAGGMVPSVSAIILLLGAVAAGRPAYGIALTLAFGVGMAAVLVGIGLGLVWARGWMDRLPQRPRPFALGRFVPAGSAAVMLVAGALIAAQGALAIR